jgi:metal-responsive CopG/Arc/MetJ family transcriptional regulator
MKEWDIMRTHVVLPDKLIEDVDKLVGKRNRSRFISEVVEERLRREGLRRAIEKGAGILSDEDYPEWSTTEKIAEWLRDLRETPSIRGEKL